MEKTNISLSHICRCVNASVFVLLAVYFLFIPFFIVIFYLNDPGLKNGGIPKFAYRLHRILSPKYEKWANHRIESQAAQNLAIENVSGTEWPLFGSIFYLMATESLQDQWEKDKSLSSVAPSKYAAGAIKASAELITDPGQAAWVKKHWGEDYLHRENVFYRMLVINGCTSYQKLLGDDKYQALLTDQVETLSKDLDDSPYGLLDDYPRQCYPTDIIAAVAAIKRADGVLGTDHSGFIKRSIRAFRGELVDSTGLPPYEADAANGLIGNVRGCSSQWMTVWAPGLWPEDAKLWYKNFEEHFWQQHFTAVGFREFPKEDKKYNWHIDVDSGPVLAGFGASASAFGIGAARVNGRFDHAYPLGAELIALSCPLLDGSLLIPRVLSNKMDAPYLGEAAVLFNLTRMPPNGVVITKAGNLPFFVYIILTLYLLACLVAVFGAVFGLKKYRRQIGKTYVPLERVQFAVWLLLFAGGVIFVIMHKATMGILFLLLAQFLPRSLTIKKEIASSLSQ
jgi:hypothetical protein